jgi:hypothetical protein
MGKAVVGGGGEWAGSQTLSGISGSVPPTIIDTSPVLTCIFAGPISPRGTQGVHSLALFPGRGGLAAAGAARELTRRLLARSMARKSSPSADALSAAPSRNANACVMTCSRKAARVRDAGGGGATLQRDRL